MSNGSSFIVTIVILLCSVNYISTLNDQNLLWNWKCNSAKALCTRISKTTNTSETLYPSIETCRLICGKYSGLWPRPSTYSNAGTTLFKFRYSAISFELPSDDVNVKNFLEKNKELLLKSLSTVDTSTCPESSNKITIFINVNSKSTNLDWTTNESYNLEITTKNQENSVKISAETVFGARHALETLSQLIEFYRNNDGSQCLVTLNQVKITDGPVYPHRGLLLDTARNFLSIPTIKRHIDGMAASKLNVLHWHVTDSQSFPLEIPSLPNMSKYGAYSSDKIYRPQDVMDLLSYAKLRGVRILIEIDAPSHSGNGWQWGPEANLGNLAVCVNQQPWRSFCIQPPCGQLNPINANLYKVLKDLYGDIVAWLPKGEIFHMGGDEVFIPCWNSTPEIIDYIGDKPRTTETFLDLWSNYQEQALEAFDSVVGDSNTPIILWTSHLTQTDVIEKYLPKNRYVIQTWVPASDPLPDDLLELGYRIIVSTKDTWYLDHGFWGTTVYHNWRNVYDNRIPSTSGTLGGEVCMWGEYVDDSCVEARTWPRAAAAAERLWSNLKGNSNQAQERFYRHRERLVSKGVNAEAVIPRWCYQNEGEC